MNIFTGSFLKVLGYIGVTSSLVGFSLALVADEHFAAGGCIMLAALGVAVLGYALAPRDTDPHDGP